MSTLTLPSELETLNAAQVGASFGRSYDWWLRVRVRYEAELGFPRPITRLCDTRRSAGVRSGKPPLLYHKAAVVEWHRRAAGLAPLDPDAPTPATPSALGFNLAALDKSA